jgi:ABC-type multidrug transport system fused ATPase/permease subunit
VKPCDRIILLDGGRCVGAGGFDELRRDNPAFAELVRLGQLESGPVDP